ncbi:hypothetical protein L6452_28072 [Arctium lappa]|uniref:Uncharacterized protein n=1 Tax=Arctium lappa TaxID=4217 RepID=A0ACB8ZX83_ARCLA|nr:hypothetical protein L6452_28072 [Arctium lappa]
MKEKELDRLVNSGLIDATVTLNKVTNEGERLGLTGKGKERETPKQTLVWQHRRGEAAPARRRPERRGSSRLATPATSSAWSITQPATSSAWSITRPAKRRLVSSEDREATSE